METSRPHGRFDKDLIGDGAVVSCLSSKADNHETSDNGTSLGVRVLKHMRIWMPSDRMGKLRSLRLAQHLALAAKVLRASLVCVTAQASSRDSCSLQHPALTAKIRERPARFVLNVLSYHHITCFLPAYALVDQKQRDCGDENEYCGCCGSESRARTLDGMIHDDGRGDPVARIKYDGRAQLGCRCDPDEHQPAHKAARHQRHRQDRKRLGWRDPEIDRGFLERGIELMNDCRGRPYCEGQLADDIGYDY